LRRPRGWDRQLGPDRNPYYPGYVPRHLLGPRRRPAGYLVNAEDPKPSLLEELKRRSVFRVAAMYAVVGWLVVEIASTVLPTFHAPEWILQVLTFLVILGFPLALVLAWAFELTPEGLKRDEDVDRAEAANRTRRGLGIAIVTLLAAATVVFALHRFVPDEPLATRTAFVGDKKSVAVLPFENMSRDASNEPFTIGIHDDLLTRISRINSIKTISRTSVLQYRDTTKTIPQIAGELGVATILEGGVQRAGDQVRINVQQTRYGSTSSSSMPRPTSISGRRPTTGSLRPPTSSPSRARSPHRSPGPCRRPYLPKRSDASEPPRPRTSPPSRPTSWASSSWSGARGSRCSRRSSTFRR
jgi:TolB-like protein